MAESGQTQPSQDGGDSVGLAQKVDPMLPVQGAEKRQRRPFSRRFFFGSKPPVMNATPVKTRTLR